MKKVRRWYYNAKRRLNWVDRVVTSKGQKLPDNYKALWQGIVQRTQAARARPEGKIPPSGVGNTDQTPVYFETVSDTTLDHKGVKSVEVRTGGKHKDRVTFQPTCFGDGSKRPGVLIFKAARAPPDGKMPRNGTVAREIMAQGANGYPPDVYLACNPEAYVYGQELRMWRIKAWRRADTRRVVLLDDYKWHKDEGFCNDMEVQNNTGVVHIDGGLTPKAQPLDIVVNRLIKDGVHEKTDSYMLTAPIVNGRMTPPSRQMLATWVAESWAAVPAGVIIRSFISAGLTEADEYDWETRQLHGLDNVHVDCSIREILCDIHLAEGDSVDDLIERLEEQTDDEADDDIPLEQLRHRARSPSGDDGQPPERRQRTLAEELD
jgi:hypothetical protein